jgi:CRP/FNR family cyclic AMP-dependent transcriptional regulator
MKSKLKSTFNPQVYLESAGVSRKVAEFRRKQAIFSQGDAVDSIMYIQKGSVKFTVVNESGKEAVVAILAPGTFWEKGAWQARGFVWGRRPPSCRRPSS